MNDSLECLDLLHLSIISNGLLTEEERIENLLGVLPYQFEPELDCDCLENHIGVGGVTQSHTKCILGIPVYLNQIYLNIYQFKYN